VKYRILGKTCCN